VIRKHKLAQIIAEYIAYHTNVNNFHCILHSGPTAGQKPDKNDILQYRKLQISSIFSKPEMEF
jgi:hypothetical protein